MFPGVKVQQDLIYNLRLLPHAPFPCSVYLFKEVARLEVHLFVH